MRIRQSLTALKSKLRISKTMFERLTSLPTFKKVALPDWATALWLLGDGSIMVRMMGNASDSSAAGDFLSPPVQLGVSRLDNPRWRGAC